MSKPYSIYDEILESLEVLRGAFIKLERRVLQEKAVAIAEEKRERFWSGMTRERYKALTTMPDPEDCLHRKGGSLRRGGFVDYNVRHHTFPDGHTSIQCLICRKEWFKDSSDWKDAVAMLNQSSNTPSSSEIIIKTPIDEVVAAEQKAIQEQREGKRNVFITKVVYQDPLFNKDEQK